MEHAVHIDSILYFDDTVLARIAQYFSRASKTYRALRATCSRWRRIMYKKPIHPLDVVGTLMAAINARDLALIDDVLFIDPHAFRKLSPSFVTASIIKRDNTFAICQLPLNNTSRAQLQHSARKDMSAFTPMYSYDNIIHMYYAIVAYHHTDCDLWMEQLAERALNADISLARTKEELQLYPQPDGRVPVYRYIRSARLFFNDPHAFILFADMTLEELKDYLSRAIAHTVPYIPQIWYYIARVATCEQICQIARIKRPGDTEARQYLGMSLIDNNRADEIAQIFASCNIARITMTFDDRVPIDDTFYACAKYGAIIDEPRSKTLQHVAFTCAIPINDSDRVSRHAGQLPCILDYDISWEEQCVVIDKIIFGCAHRACDLDKDARTSSGRIDLTIVKRFIVLLIWRGLESYAVNKIHPRSIDDTCPNVRTCGSRVMRIIQYIARKMREFPVIQREKDKLCNVFPVINRTVNEVDNLRVIMVRIQKILLRDSQSRDDDTQCQIAYFLHEYLRVVCH